MVATVGGSDDGAPGQPAPARAPARPLRNKHAMPSTDRTGPLQCIVLGTQIISGVTSRGPACQEAASDDDNYNETK